MDGINLNLDNYLTQATAQISSPEFIISLALTAITAYILKAVYVRFGQALSNRSVFSNTFVPIAMTTMVIITIVKSSLALSLGLVGALSIIRFRTAIKETEQIILLLMVMALSISIASEKEILAVIFTIVYDGSAHVDGVMNACHFFGSSIPITR